MPKRQKLKPVTVDAAVAAVAFAGLDAARDGQSAVFVKSAVKPGAKTRAQSIYLVSANGKVRRLTQGPDDGQACLTPDGKTVLFTRKPGDDKPPQIHSIAVDGGEASPLVEFDGGPEAIQALPDGKHLSFLAATPDDKSTKARKEKGDDAREVLTDDKHKRVWVAPVNSGKPKACSPDDLSVWECDWLPDGKSAVVAYTQEPRLDAQFFQPQLGLLDRGTAKIKPIDAGLRFLGGPRVSPDGQTVALTANDTDAPHGDAWVVDIASGAALCLTRGIEATVILTEWTPDGSRVICGLAEGMGSRIVTVNPATPGEMEPLCDLPAPLMELASVAGDGSVYATLQGFDQPPELWRVGPEVKPKKLTRVNAKLGHLRLGKSELRTWKSTDGFEIEGIVTLPPSYRTGKPYPTVLVVHGGPAGRFSENFGLLPRQLLANAGYVVIMPNPRGSSGYGHDFVRANYGDWGGGDLRDLLAGVDMLIDEGIADPERLAIYGGSYGGYMAAWTVSQTDRFKAAVCQCGLSNLFSFNSQTDIQSFLQLYFGASPYEEPERYAQHSAMTFIKQVKTPTLFLHGEQDVRVPIPQSYEMFWGMKHFGIETEFVLYPREGHGILEPAHQRDLYGRIIDWLGKHLKGGRR